MTFLPSWGLFSLLSLGAQVHLATPTSLPSSKGTVPEGTGHWEAVKGQSVPWLHPHSFRPGWGVFQPSVRGLTPARKMRYA